VKDRPQFNLCGQQTLIRKGAYGVVRTPLVPLRVTEQGLPQAFVRAWTREEFR